MYLFLPRLDSKEVMHHQSFNKPIMSNNIDMTPSDSDDKKLILVNVQGLIKLMVILSKLLKHKLYVDPIGHYYMWDI